MIPGSFFFRRCSDQWLVSKTASKWFAASSLIVIVVMTPIGFGYWDHPGASPVRDVIDGVLGIAGGVSSLLLWGGMWRYWARIDASSRAVKTAWFVVLLLSVWYGAILYYLAVYLRRTQHPVALTPAPLLPKQRQFTVFFYCLVAGWATFLTTVALCFVFPKSMGHLLHSGAPIFTAIAAVLSVATCLYKILRFYRAGMVRTTP